MLGREMKNATSRQMNDNEQKKMTAQILKYNWTNNDYFDKYNLILQY